MMRPSVRPGASLALFAITISLLAGCANPPASKCVEASCGSTPAPSITNSSAQPPQTLPPPVNASLPYLVFEKCHGLLTGIDVEGGKAQTFFPSVFRYRSAIPFTALFGFLALQCPRVSIENATFSDVRMSWTFVAVDPKTESWKLQGIHYYVFDVTASDSEVVKRLRVAGVPATNGTLGIATSDAAGQAVIESWNVKSPGVELAFNFKHPAAAQSGGDEHKLRWWFGDKQFNLLTTNEKKIEYEAAGSDDDVVRTSGPSAFHSAIGDSSAFRANTLASVDWVLDPNLQAFSV